jgi:hypothetical protein
MADIKGTWERVRGWYHFPALKEPKVVEKLDGGACYDFRHRETLVDSGFISELREKGSISEEKALEGVFAHEIGHYMVFPRDLGTLILAAKMIDDFFDKRDVEIKGFILQTYADMANDTSSVLEEQRTSAILDMRKACQETLDDPVNKNVRAVMLAYLHHQAQRPFELDEELKQYKERMLEIDFLNPDVNKMRIGIWTFGNIIIDMIEKYADKGSCGRIILVLDHGDSDIFKQLKEATPDEIKEALRDIAFKITKKEWEKVKEWVKGHGGKVVKLPGIKSIGTSEGELPVDKEVLEYYKQLSIKYPLIVTKKLLDTDSSTRSWSETKKWRAGDDPNLALPNTSGGLFLPGVTRSIRINERPMRTTDYRIPHLLVVIDSSGSMPEPKEQKSHAVIGGYCAARSYHLHGSSIGVINFSGKSFYLPYTRELDEALGAISAYQGGGTVADVEMIRKMLGPEMAELYAKNPELGLRRLPREAVKKEISISVPDSVFSAESIDLMMFTDGGIYNLDEVLDLFEEKSELNRATIVLAHGFGQDLAERMDSRINIVRVEDEKDIPSIVLRETQKSFATLSEGIRK